MAEQQADDKGLVDHAEPVAVEKTANTSVTETNLKDSTGTVPVTSHTQVNLGFESENNNESHVDDGKDPGHEVVNGVTPVYYTSGGNAQIGESPVVITREDGSRWVRTPMPNMVPPPKRQVREKDLKYLKCFVVVAIIAFFPTGILALYFCVRTHTEFKKGMQSSNMTVASKMARITERLIVASVISGLIIGAISVAVAEHIVYAGNHEYWDRRNGFGRGTP